MELFRRSRQRWVQIGVVAVDSGTCLVLDPTYLRDGLCGMSQIEAAGAACGASDGRTAVVTTTADAPAGVVVQTGYGDDVYPVEARYADAGGRSRRLAEIRIRFM